MSRPLQVREHYSNLTFNAISKVCLTDSKMAHILRPPEIVVIPNKTFTVVLQSPSTNSNPLNFSQHKIFLILTNQSFIGMRLTNNLESLYFWIIKIKTRFECLIISYVWNYKGSDLTFHLNHFIEQNSYVNPFVFIAMSKVT